MQYDFVCISKQSACTYNKECLFRAMLVFHAYLSLQSDAIHMYIQYDCVYTSNAPIECNLEMMLFLGLDLWKMSSRNGR